MLPRITALLPLKINSQRVPGKNFKQLGNKPLFFWILNTLLNTESISEIVINTDAESELVKSGLKKHSKIKIITRPPEICGDLISMNKIIEYDLSQTQSDIYLMTHVTNPFLSTQTIESAINTFQQSLKKNSHDSLFSVTKHQCRFYDKALTPINHNLNELIPTQDLPIMYEENSLLYLFTKNSFNTTNARIGKRPAAFETPFIESVDIDTPDDWQLAKSIAKIYT
jgi:CMP-N-acetylneuraminic acid synthetase